MRDRISNLERRGLPVDRIEDFYENENGQGHAHGLGGFQTLAGNVWKHPGLSEALALVRLE